MRTFHYIILAALICIFCPEVLALSDDQLPPAESTIVGGYTGLTYSGSFNWMVWIAGVLVGGVGSFFIFLGLHHHKRFRVAGDQHWPMLFTVTVPFLLVAFPIFFPGNPVLDYGDWGSKCFDRATYRSRVYEPDPNGSDTVEKACIAAQASDDVSPITGSPLSHNALGLSRAYGAYKDTFLNGRSNAMFPGEMLFLLWLVLSVVGISIYQLLLRIRQRFFVH